MPLEPVMQVTEPPVLQWSWAGTSHWSWGTSHGKTLSPPELSPSLLTFCPSACLPAIAIPVVHLHLDGPARQRARGGMNLTQHLWGLNGALPLLLGQKGIQGPPLGSSCPHWRRSSPRDKGTILRPFG